MTDEIPFKDEMAKKALSRIRHLGQGNGAQKDTIQIVKNNSEMIMCEAITHIELMHEVKENRKKGQLAIGEPIEDPAKLPKIIEEVTSSAIKNTDVRKALSGLLLNRADKGFALHAQFFDFPPLNKQYCYSLPCQTCQGNSKMACQTCQGRRLERCNQCHGQTVINCSFCHGSGFMKGPDGNQKQCNRCFGKRSIKCPLCQSRGTISCRGCKGTGESLCASCGGVGVYTHIIKVFFKIKTLFEIDRAALPHPAVKMIEDKGTPLIKGGHIQLQAEPVKREDGGLAIQYNVRFPYADLDIGVNGKPLKVHMFGFKYTMLKISNFIDQLIEKNYALLQRAGAGDGNVASHLKKASKTRIIGEGILLSVTKKPKEAMIELKKKFPVGASNGLIKDIIIQSNKALIHVSRKSHWGGIGIGLIITAVINIGYFIGPIRLKLSNIIGADLNLTLADFSLIPLCAFIMITISKYMTASPLKKALGGLMPKKQRSTFVPRNNNAKWPAYLGSVIIFLIVIYVGKIIGFNAPSWFPL